MRQERMITCKLPNGATGVRIEPKMPPTAYRSFEIHSPITTHYRSVSCKDMECQYYLGGWVSKVDVSTMQGRKWAVAIRNSGRRYTYEQRGSEVVFHFFFGQSCFQAPHKVRLERPELYIVRDGDWRTNPTGRKAVDIRPSEFVERMADNLDVLHRAKEQG